MPSPFDFHVLARIMADQPDRWRASRLVRDLPTAGRSAGRHRHPRDRETILDVFLAGRPDRDAIIRAMADAGPDATATGRRIGPAAESTGRPCVSRNCPRSSRSRWMCCPIRPPGWSSRERTRSVALGTSSGLPMLAVAAGTIGRSASLHAQARLLRRRDHLSRVASARPRMGRRPP